MNSATECVSILRTEDIVLTKQGPCPHRLYVLVGIKLHLEVRLGTSLEKQALCLYNRK